MDHSLLTLPLCVDLQFYAGTSEAIRICISKIETVDNTTTKEAIIASCICFPVALDYMCVLVPITPLSMSLRCSSNALILIHPLSFVSRKNPHDSASRSLWDELNDLKSLVVRELDSSYVSIRLAALRFVQVVVVNFTLPNPAPVFRNLAKNAAQSQRLAPSFQLNRVPTGHPILHPDAMIRTAEELWRTQIRDRLLSYIDASSSSGNVSIISALMNLCCVILQTRIQFVEPVVAALADFYQDYMDPPTRFERKSLAHTIQSTMDAILKYDIGHETSLLAKCRSGRVARGRKARELEMMRKQPQPFGMHAVTFPGVAESKMAAGSGGAMRPVFGPPPSTLGRSQTSEALSRMISGILSRLAKPNSNLYSGFALVARIAVELPLEDPAIERLFELIEASANLPPGKGLVLMWVNAEYNSYLLNEQTTSTGKTDPTTTDASMDVDPSSASAHLESPPHGSNFARYMRIVEASLEKLASSDHLPGLVLDLPELFDTVFTFLSNRVKISRSPDLYLSTLKGVTVSRPPYRQKALQLLLDFTKDENDLLQSKLLMRLKELMTHTHLAESIVNYAKKQLELLLDDPDVIKREEEIKQAEEASTDAKPADRPLTPIQVNAIVKKYLYLYLGLYAERPDLLQGAVEVYSRLKAEELRAGISRSIMFRVKTVGIDHPTLIEAIVRHPKNTDKLALELCEANGPTQTLTRAVIAAVNADELDGRFAACVFPGLTKEEAYATFPKLLTLPQPTLRRITSATLARMPGFPFTPEELLVQLHVSKGPGGVESLKEAAMWIGMMFDDPSRALLKIDILFPALVSIVQTSPLPILFFRTLLLAISHLKAMEPYAINLLSRPEVMSPTVWADARHRQGFVNSCEKLLPLSIPLVLNLPLDRFEMVLTMKPSIKDAIRQRIIFGQAVPFEKQHLFKDVTPVEDVTNSANP